MFAKITNGAVDKFPYTVGQLRHDNPNTSFPKQIPEALMLNYGMVPVSEVPAPEFDPLTHFAEWGPVPELQEGSWVLLPTVREYSEDQLAERAAAKASEVRSQRDKLLAETDWMALSDVVMSPEMTAYRQALRDITDQVGFPHTVEWPVKP
jgi:hypothetical protein